MKTISSRTNSLIKQVSSLQTKRRRQEHQQFIAEGLRTCKTLIDAGHEPVALFVTEAQLDEAQKIASDEQIILVPDFVMQKISAATTPSGMVGQFSIPKAPTALEGNGLVLAQIADPGNMGALIRTAAALNVKNIVVIEGVDPWSPKVVQASAGTIGMVKLFPWSFEELIKRKKSHLLHALVIFGGEKIAPLKENWLLMVGSEAHGIPEMWIATCDNTLTIPMPGDAESLNVAIAGSIALYIAISPSS